MWNSNRQSDEMLIIFNSRLLHWVKSEKCGFSQMPFLPTFIKKGDLIMILSRDTFCPAGKGFEKKAADDIAFNPSIFFE